ncbi:MAG: tetratricopeptide repeat protein [bacterium]
MIERFPGSLMIFLALAVWWGMWIYIRSASGMLRLSRMLFIGIAGTLVIALAAMRWSRTHPVEYLSPILIEVSVFRAPEEDQVEAMNARFALRLLLEVADPGLITDDSDSPTPDLRYDSAGASSDSALARAHRHRAVWLVRGDVRSSKSEGRVTLALILIRLDAEGGPVRNERITVYGQSGAEAGLNASREILELVGRKVACEVCLEPYTSESLTASADAARIANPNRRERFLMRRMPKDESLQPYYWTEVAILRLNLGDSDGAYEAASRALTSATQLAPAWGVLAEVESQRGHGAEAKRLYRRTLAEDPRNVDALLDLATLVERSGHGTVGMSRELLLKRAVQVRPGNIFARLALAEWIEKNALQPEKALEILREGYDFTGDKRLLQRESAVLIRMNRWNQAERVLERVLALDETDANAWYNLGLTLRNLKQLAAAENALQRSVKLGGSADAHFVLGLVYEARGDTASALQEYRLRWALRDPTMDDRTANAAKARVRFLTR